MSMTTEVKELLRAAKARKRGNLLKDVDPMALAIFAVDHFNEHATLEEQEADASGQWWGRLSWATPAQHAALARFLPNHWGHWFPYHRLLHSLRQLVTEPKKYLRRPFVVRSQQGLRQPTG